MSNQNENEIKQQQQQQNELEQVESSSASLIVAVSLTLGLIILLLIIVTVLTTIQNKNRKKYYKLKEKEKRIKLGQSVQSLNSTNDVLNLLSESSNYQNLNSNENDNIVPLFQIGIYPQHTINSNFHHNSSRGPNENEYYGDIPIDENEKDIASLFNDYTNENLKSRIINENKSIRKKENEENISSSDVASIFKTSNLYSQTLPTLSNPADVDINNVPYQTTYKLPPEENYQNVSLSSYTKMTELNTRYNASEINNAESRISGRNENSKEKNVNVNINVNSNTNTNSSSMIDDDTSPLPYYSMDLSESEFYCNEVSDSLSEFTDYTISNTMATTTATTTTAIKNDDVANTSFSPSFIIATEKGLSESNEIIFKNNTENNNNSSSQQKYQSSPSIKILHQQQKSKSSKNFLNLRNKDSNDTISTSISSIMNIRSIHKYSQILTNDSFSDLDKESTGANNTKLENCSKNNELNNSDNEAKTNIETNETRNKKNENINKHKGNSNATSSYSNIKSKLNSYASNFSSKNKNNYQIITENNIKEIDTNNKKNKFMKNDKVSSFQQYHPSTLINNDEYIFNSKSYCSNQDNNTTTKVNSTQQKENSLLLRNSQKKIGEIEKEKKDENKSQVLSNISNVKSIISNSFNQISNSIHGKNKIENKNEKNGEKELNKIEIKEIKTTGNIENIEKQNNNNNNNNDYNNQLKQRKNDDTIKSYISSNSNKRTSYNEMLMEIQNIEKEDMISSFSGDVTTMDFDSSYQDLNSIVNMDSVEIINNQKRKTITNNNNVNDKYDINSDEDHIITDDKYNDNSDVSHIIVDDMKNISSNYSSNNDYNKGVIVHNINNYEDYINHNIKSPKVLNNTTIKNEENNEINNNYNNNSNNNCINSNINDGNQDLKISKENNWLDGSVNNEERGSKVNYKNNEKGIKRDSNNTYKSNNININRNEEMNKTISKNYDNEQYNINKNDFKNLNNEKSKVSIKSTANSSNCYPDESMPSPYNKAKKSSLSPTSTSSMFSFSNKKIRTNNENNLTFSTPKSQPLKSPKQNQIKIYNYSPSSQKHKNVNSPILLSQKIQKNQTQYQHSIPVPTSSKTTTTTNNNIENNESNSKNQMSNRQYYSTLCQKIFKAQCSYASRKNGNVTINVGDYVQIYQIFEDGWAFGRIESINNTGTKIVESSSSSSPCRNNQVKYTEGVFPVIEMIEKGGLVEITNSNGGFSNNTINHDDENKNINKIKNKTYTSISTPPKTFLTTPRQIPSSPQQTLERKSYIKENEGTPKKGNTSNNKMLNFNTLNQHQPQSPNQIKVTNSPYLIDNQNGENYERSMNFERHNGLITPKNESNENRKDTNEVINQQKNSNINIQKMNEDIRDIRTMLRRGGIDTGTRKALQERLDQLELKMKKK